MLWVALHFPNLAREALEPIAAWACQFTPRVSLEPPCALVLEASGSLRLFGGGKPFLRRLPREGLARRCPEQLLVDLDWALGALPEPREYFVPPEHFDVKLELPGEVNYTEGVLFAARRLLVQLEGLLAARQAGI